MRAEGAASTPGLHWKSKVREGFRSSDYDVERGIGLLGRTYLSAREAHSDDAELLGVRQELGFYH